MNIQQLQALALQVAQKYDEQNKQNGKLPWNASAYMAGFVGDVGDLSKLVMAKSGYRDIESVDEELAHELSDCLWSILVLADRLGIDLDVAFQRTMKDLSARFDT